MRINIVMGFFLPMPPAAGGATEKSWHRLSVEFARRGHEVTVVSRTWPGWPDRETIEGVRHVRIPGHDHSSRLSRNLRMDFFWSLRAGRALPPAEVTIVNCVALPLWLGWLRGSAGRLVVMTGRVPKGQYRLYRRVDRILAVSTPVRDAILAENPRLGPLIRVCGYPIDWTALSRPRPGPPSPRPVVIGYVGRIHREKGLDILAGALGKLAAIPGLPPWRALLCGPVSVAQGGSGEAYARDLAKILAGTLPVGSWDMSPPVYDEETLVSRYREIDVFCYPSLAARGETFGVAVAEAMAAGSVPVVSQLPCFSDFLSPGRNGYAFDAGASDASGRLCSLLAAILADPAGRARMASEARAGVAGYDFVPFADRLLADFSAWM